MKKKKLMIGFVVLFFLVISTTILASATVYPKYNTEQDCRGCHGSDVSDRHHLLVANGTRQCTDCHPIQYDNVTQQYSPQVIRNCLICHPGKDHTDVHHILASKGLFVCSDCHPLTYDNASQTFSPKITWDCTVCHSTVFSIQNVTPTPTPTPTPDPTPTPQNVTITNFTPVSPVTNFVGDSRTFHVIMDQNADVTWSINGTPVQSDANVTDSGYTNISATLGTWNVSVTGSNIYGNVTYTWEWIVIIPPPPPETPSINGNFPLYSSVNDTVGSSRKFGISINQNVSVQWLINGSEVQSNENTNGSNYTNTSAPLGIWNVDAIVNNTNGTDMYRWIWNVTPIQSSQPVIISYNPTLFPNDTAGGTRIFNITINQTVNVAWYINGSQVSSDTNVTYSGYTNTSAKAGIWNVSAIVSNPNGSTINSWTWNVTPTYSPPGIVGYSPNSTVNDTEGSSRTFNIMTNQTANITWYINGNSVQFDPGVISSSYINISASTGIWNVKAVATNPSGNITQSWIWNVVSNPKPNTTIQQPNGKYGWYVTSTIYLNATDNDGIKYTNYSVDGGEWNNSQGSSISLKAPIISSGEVSSTRNFIYSLIWRTSINLSDGNHSIRYYSVDNLNGVEPTKTQSVKIDKTPPQITIKSPINGSVYVLNQKLIANWSVSDTTSGIVPATATYPNGSVISTASIGTKSFSISAADNAGNTNKTNVTYYIRYNFGGFLAPIVNDGSSIFRPGSKINIRFKLSDANLKNVATATAKLNFSLINPNITGKILQPFSSDSASVDGVFKYDSKNMWYYYNLDSKGLTSGTWQIRADTNDGGSYTVNISIQK